MKLNITKIAGTTWYEGNTYNYTNKRKLNVFFTTRLGGVSSGQFASLNFSYNVGDDTISVNTNYQLFYKASNLLDGIKINGQQTHGTNITRVNNAINHDGETISDCDGLYTTELNISLLAHFADCVPIYFWDDSLHVIAIVHAGRKGTYHNITSKMIRSLSSDAGVDIINLNALIGPCICEKCYEVGFQEYKTFVDKGLITDSGKFDNSNNCYNLNLRKINRLLLVNSGIDNNKVFDLDICTCCNPNQFFSYRYNYSKGGMTGRMMAVINLTKLGE